MTMDLSSWREHATQDDRHAPVNARIGGDAGGPWHGRAAAAALILWTCTLISLAWVTFLLLLTRMR
ncbi:hypothetical protein VSR68_30670 [Paraburkholderia phymatum]|uniref:hypothetical protein n=1 Tax=Paraburkholderia phymatum TaxID=148447 RepID=UPI003176705C